MTITLALVFGCMVFILILNKANFLFINFGTLLFLVAVSFGVGYAIAVFLVSVIAPLIKIIAIAAIVVIGVILLAGITGRKGE